MQKAKRSNYKAAVSAALPFFYRKLLISFLLTTCLCLFAWLAYCSSYPELPSEKHPFFLYSNQARNNLKLVFLRAIESAQSSIFLIIYGLTDEDIIQALRKKAAEGIDLKVFYDKGGSKDISTLLPQGITYPIKSSGLMHKKILIIDDTQVFLGSANLTETSLRMHDNLVIGCSHKGLADYLQSSSMPCYQFYVQGQPIELWSLPEPEMAALARVIEEIHKAKKSLRICMFTFTHKEITKALIQARQRGIQVEVAFDHYAAKGSSRAILELLQNNGIQTFIGKGGKLLHHKWCLIDEKTLILGSTNWTAAAFSKNDDCLIFLKDLLPSQVALIDHIWDTLDFSP